MFLLAENARKHVPQGSGSRGTEPVHGGNRKHPRTVLVDPQGYGGSDRKGDHPRPCGHREGTAERTSGSGCPVIKRALVIGGGIAGIQTALDIADAGFEVDIVEKQPTIGGKMTQLDKTFPTLDCAACILTPKMVECAQNELINIYSYSEVDAVSGFVGNFSVKIRKKARYVDETKCTGCGLCTEKCPQKKVPNEFNLGMDNRRAVYIPFAQAVPKVATIDADARC